MATLDDFTSFEDLTVGFKADLSFIRFNNSDIQIVFDSHSGLSDFTYLDSSNNVGHVSDFGVILDRYRELRGENEYVRGGFEFSDPLTGDRRAVLSQITSVDLQGDPSYGGRLVLSGTLLDLVEDGGTEDLDEIVGERFQRLHNDDLEQGRRFNHYWGGALVASQVDCFLDTYTIEEFKSFNPGNSLIQSSSFQEDFLSESFTIPSNALVLLGPEGDRLDGLSGEASLDLINIQKNWSKPKADVGLDVKVTPKISAKLNFPDHFWEYLSPSKYQVQSDLTLDWSFDASLKNKLLGNGTVEFDDYTYDGPSKTFYPGPFNVTLKSSADLTASASLSGIKSDYQFGASQTLGARLTYAPGSDVSLEDISTPVDTSKTTADFADVDLGFQAGVTPKLALKFGYSIPAGSPYWAGKSIATLDGNVDFPLTFNLDLSKSEGLSGVFGAKGELSADIKLLEFWDGGWTFDLGGTTFMDLKSENIFA